MTEIYFEPDPTSLGETPGSSVNLSQRNLSILFSDNAGAPGAHVAVHTFEIKPSSIPALPKNFTPELVGAIADVPFLAALTHDRRVSPDELLFNWHNLPDEAEISVYSSDVDTGDIERLGGPRLSRGSFEPSDNRTLTFRAGDISWVPLPGGRATNIPALLIVRLPDTVHYGETYHLSVHQVDGSTRQIIGSFEVSIPVAQPEVILDEDVRNLSVLRHVATPIPPGNRWYPIFLRYLGLLAGKVDALGGDSTTVHGNPDGSGRPYEPPQARTSMRSCLEGWLVALVAAAGLAIAGLAPSFAFAGVAAAVAITAIVILVAFWARRCCRPIRCGVLDYVGLGLAIGASVLIVASLLRIDTPALAAAVTFAVLALALDFVLAFVWRCRGACCDSSGGCQEESRTVRPPVMQRAVVGPIPPRPHQEVSTRAT